jgi:hypothetical protein
MNGHEIALWSAVFAFFGSLLAIGIFDVFNPDQWVEYIGAIIVAVITGGSIYAKERLSDAKKDSPPSDSTLSTPRTTHKKSE